MAQGQQLGLGLIGGGGFGTYCLEAFRRLGCVRLVAAARAAKPDARALCDRLGVRVLDSYEEVIACEDVGVVHVATPPESHYRLALAALRAGKHVLCEKPPALCAREAEALARAADEAGVFFAPNFVMRFSPIAGIVRDLVRGGALGRVLAADVTNCASDAGLPPDHWFWAKDTSGGIFIEHGVHFFDLYAWWLGPGEVLSAHAERRERGGQEDRVTCTVRHALAGHSGIPVTHYHGFDQVAPMDRTEHRLVCELGDVRVEGWLPQRLTVDAAVDDASLGRLRGCLPDAEAEVLEEYPPGRRDILGRGEVRHVTKRVRLRYSLPQDKESLYADAIRALLADQVAWVRDRGHRRHVTARQGVEALACAESAARLAEAGARGGA